MTEEKIRLRYSGFIMFLFRLISVGTGLLFTLMVTRSIQPEEYGIYNNLGDVLSYFTLASAIIPFWVTRFVARQQRGSCKTGVATNTLVGVASTIVYLLAISSIMSSFQIDWKYLPIYLAAAFIIIEHHILAVFEATLHAKRPETLGFGLFALEISKVLLGFLIVINMKAGLMGVLIVLILAFSTQALFYLKYLLHEFREKIVWAYAKEWFKASLLNVYGIVGGRILALANLILFIYGGELSRAYYGVSSVIASIIGYSSSLAFALYPKLLSGAELKDVTLSIKMVLMFAVPMTLGAIILSKELLLILNPLYSFARAILIILSLCNLFSVLSSLFESIISGTEKLDAEAKISYSMAIRSKLFLLLTLNYIQAAIVVPSTYILLKSLSPDALSSALYLAVVNAVANILTTLAKYAIARRCMEFSIPWMKIGEYLGASLIMALVVYVFQAPARLSITVFRILTGALVYFLVLSAIDKETRGIINLVKREAAKIF